MTYSALYTRPHRALTALLLVVLLATTACSSTKNKPGKIGDQSEQNLYNTAQTYLKNRFWDDAINALQSIEENYPFGEYAQQAQLELIYAYYKNLEPEAASAAADRFIRLHPQHPNVDYAYYIRGLTVFTRSKGILRRYVPVDITARDPGNAKRSFAYFSELVTRFPNSDYTPDATKRMEYLRNLLARHEIHIANYYFKREAYLAAVNRGRYVIENFQQTPAVPDALAVMVQGYKLLGMDALSADSLAVLSANYPDYPSIDEEGNFTFQQTGKRSSSWINRLTLGFFDRDAPPGFDSRKHYPPK